MPTDAAAPVSLKIDAQTKDRIKRLAQSRQRSAHWVMHQAIEQYVDREEKRDAFREQALQAWQSYQETGLHVSGEEVSAWLESWGSDDELPAPECYR